MSLEGYKLAEAIIVSQHAEAIASYLGHKEKEDKYKKQKEKLKNLDEYESVTVFHILLAEENLKKFTLHELINIADNLSDGSDTERGDTLRMIATLPAKSAAVLKTTEAYARP
jgi:hypothetical protein